MTKLKLTQIAQKSSTFLASKREGMEDGGGGGVEAILALTLTGAAEGDTEGEQKWAWPLTSVSWPSYL